MHAFHVVHCLRHMQIAGETAHRIGFILVDAGHADDPVDHFLQRLAGRIVEVGVEPERDKWVGVSARGIFHPSFF